MAAVSTNSCLLKIDTDSVFLFKVLPMIDCNISRRNLLSAWITGGCDLRQVVPKWIRLNYSNRNKSEKPTPLCSALTWLIFLIHYLQVHIFSWELPFFFTCERNWFCVNPPNSGAVLMTASCARCGESSKLHTPNSDGDRSFTCTHL